MNMFYLLTLALAEGAKFSWAFIFWLLMLSWLVGGFYSYWPRTGVPGGSWPLVGNNLLLFILLVILGIGVFGSPLPS